MNHRLSTDTVSDLIHDISPTLIYFSNSMYVQTNLPISPNEPMHMSKDVPATIVSLPSPLGNPSIYFCMNYVGLIVYIPRSHNMQ